MSDKIHVQVAYALPERQDIVTMELAAGATAQQAVEASGLLQKYPDIDLAKNKLGVFSKLVKADQVLRDRDRVEIYRGLTFDPKESRRRRAEHRRAKTARNGRIRPAGLL